MRQNLLSAVAGLLALSISVSAGAAERRRSAELPPPPQFRVDVATRTMTMARLANQVPVGSSVGRFCFAATLYCAEPIPILSDHAFRGVPQTEYAARFTTEAQAAGYNIPASTTDLFQSGDAGQAELMVGAAITQLALNGAEKTVFAQKYELDASVSVDWQVFDPLEKKIVFRGSSQGTAHVENSEGPNTLPREGARAAFQAAAKAILAQPEFLVAVKDPRGGTPAQPGALFPEANTSAAPQSAPTTQSVQIARVPLGATPFRHQVKDVMKQVITVMTPRGNGSGFYISDGLILTNEHVVSGYTDTRIKFFGGREVAGRVIATNARRDIALIKTENVGVSGLPLRTEQPDIASPVFVIGSPLDPKFEGSVISGIVSGFREEEFGPMIQSDVQVTHGNSGGPMFDENGNVIGLVDMGRLGQKGEATAVNLFIPIADGLAKLNIQANLPAGSPPIAASTTTAPGTPAAN